MSGTKKRCPTRANARGTIENASSRRKPCECVVVVVVGAVVGDAEEAVADDAVAVVAVGNAEGPCVADGGDCDNCPLGKRSRREGPCEGSS